ncbi:DDE-type integrase/transposase/recombinase [Serratia proteamaculans]|uniref:DDE-type integrase/transposase/recombinase n=1 Tax=Serratia proteamaculans TaxID=28151 RepID=UPI00391854EF
MISPIVEQRRGLYLAIVIDLCSRKIVSWAFSDKPDRAMTIRALRLAVNKRRPTGPVVFHRDSNNAGVSFYYYSVCR